MAGLSGLSHDDDASGSFDPDAVSLVECEPSGELEFDEEGRVHGWHTWANDNPVHHALFEVRVLVNGEPVPLADLELTDDSVKVDATTYQIEVGPEGAEHTVGFWLPEAEFSEGESAVEAWMSDPEQTRGGGL